MKLKWISVALATTAALASACGSDALAEKGVAYGSSSEQVAKELGVCANPQPLGNGLARCDSPGNGYVVIGGVKSKDEQAYAVSVREDAAECYIVGKGFVVGALNRSQLDRTVDVPAVRSKFGDVQYVGSAC